MPIDQLEKLWAEHQDAPFPAQCRGEDCDGIDLVMLDADIAGCISTFLARKGSLDQTRLAVLGLCYRDVCFVLPRLDADAATHYRRLELMARLALEHVLRFGG